MNKDFEISEKSPLKYLLDKEEAIYIYDYIIEKYQKEFNLTKKDLKDIDRSLATIADFADYVVFNKNTDKEFHIHKINRTDMHNLFYIYHMKKDEMYNRLSKRAKDCLDKVLKPIYNRIEEDLKVKKSYLLENETLELNYNELKELYKPMLKEILLKDNKKTSNEIKYNNECDEEEDEDNENVLKLK